MCSGMEEGEESEKGRRGRGYGIEEGVEGEGKYFQWNEGVYRRG